MLTHVNSDNGPLLLVTIAHTTGGYVGHRILLNGPAAGCEVSATKVCSTRDEAMAIMQRNSPILTDATSQPSILQVILQVNGD